jgi:four helix bundle protein
MESFNEKYRDRTFKFAVRIVKFCMKKRSEGLPYDLFSQLLRSGTSYPVNFRSATQARSDAEFYSKLCIVVEECDETLFWLDLLVASGIVANESELVFLKNETDELVKVFSKVKHDVGKRIGKTYQPENKL